MALLRREVKRGRDRREERESDVSQPETVEIC